MKLHLLVGALLAGPVLAETTFPGPEWKDEPSPLASPHAVPGGEVSIYAHQYPQSFNYYLDNNSFNADLFGSLYESLLSIDGITADYAPGLASSWTISDDKRVFTFTIDERAVWSDGTPITAHDVVFTFETIRDPKNLTGPHKVGLDTFDTPEALDDRTVRFTAREVHWRNLGTAGGLLILPKHVMEGKDFNRIQFEFPVVSGPYRIGEISEGRFVKLERRDDWWGRELPRNQNAGNFQTLTYRFFTDTENAFESFRRGLIDVFPVYMARIWVNESTGPRFDQNWIVKQKVYNYNPIGFQGFAMNMRRPPFDDLRVRQALAYLLNREKMNSTIMYNQYFMHRSYFEDLYDQEHPCENPEFPFDKDRARALLEEAGWIANPRTGKLEKDGRPFVITFLTRDPSADKFLAIYGEDLKDVGIELRIDRKDWAAWTKDMDEFNYDMTWAAWGSGLFKDPESMWHSREADRPSGNNITGFRSEAVDGLIEKQKSVFDVRERNAILREIDAIITRDVPYVLLWNINYRRLLYWNKFGTPPQVLSKFGDERSAYALWWYDEDAAADLQEAMAENRGLPARPVEVRFDDAFRE
ncbi:MAG TPA: extracellular solute-binding protein [Kiritimatiellia bacterium]|nr:extracellular solute-binding protein [Kiritimatiellia bacterium]HMO99597.1 extracellular solute-binding protein [Kiritimatiellia bacterium]HMP96014.1 extracellular solute-binding protein [Kiritimatiellia bacterium]